MSRLYTLSICRSNLIHIVTTTRRHFTVSLISNLTCTNRWIKMDSTSTKAWTICKINNIIINPCYGNSLNIWQLLFWQQVAKKNLSFWLLYSCEKSTFNWYENHLADCILNNSFVTNINYGQFFLCVKFWNDQIYIFCRFSLASRGR